MNNVCPIHGQELPCFACAFEVPVIKSAAEQLAEYWDQHFPPDWSLNLLAFRRFMELGTVSVVKCAISSVAARYRRRRSIQSAEHARCAVLQKLKQYKSINAGEVQPVQTTEQFLQQHLNQ
jgi:hypothetical protein